MFLFLENLIGLRWVPTHSGTGPARIDTDNRFYKQGAKASVSFVQASPVDEHMAAAGTGGFGGAYQGNQAQGTGARITAPTLLDFFVRIPHSAHAGARPSRG